MIGSLCTYSYHMMNAPMSPLKRPATEGEASPSAPLAKRQNLAADGVGDGQNDHVSPLSAPFLRCHLTMLKSLYDGSGDTSTGRSHEEQQESKARGPQNTNDLAVEDEVWDLIDIFLTNRNGLSAGKDESHNLRMAHNCAVDILKSNAGSICSGNGGSHRTISTQSPVPSTPLIRRPVLSTPSSRSIGGTTITSDAACGATAETEGQKSINSWALVTKILGRQSAAADAQARAIAMPYQPLVTALKRKIRELEEIHESILIGQTSGNLCSKDKTVSLTNVGDIAVGGDDFDAIQALLDKKTAIAPPEKDEDVLERVECKSQLWQLLLNYVFTTAGIDVFY